MNYPVFFIDGKDCSEYAEDIINKFGGHLITVIDKQRKPFWITYFGKKMQACYHTIVLFDSGLVVDVTSAEKYFNNKNELLKYLQRQNPKSNLEIQNGLTEMFMF